MKNSREKLYLQIELEFPKALNSHLVFPVFTVFLLVGIKKCGILVYKYEVQVFFVLVRILCLDLIILKTINESIQRGGYLL